jgi:PilZ domain
MEKRATLGVSRGMRRRLDEVEIVNEREKTDRRHSDRFPIEREVRYRVMNKRGNDEAGEGKTINISSSGVLFTSQHLLLPGRRMELSINWPAQLNNKCALKLVARGRVIRFEQGIAAIEIQQYEFRTAQLAGTESAQVRASPLLSMN